VEGCTSIQKHLVRPGRDGPLGLCSNQKHME
jgi:hypothetical protein